MARKFLDTSAMMKLYVAEADTPLAQAEVASATEVLISEWTLLEIRSAFYGLVRGGALTAVDADFGIQSFENDLPAYGVRLLTSEVLNRAKGLLDRYAVSDGLRPPDAVQLAAALVEHDREPVDTFLTWDQVQSRVALASGLVVLP